jgi:hypothetical protein
MTPEHSSEKGHFEHGRWVDGEPPDAAGSGSDEDTVDFGIRIEAVSADISRVIGNVISLGRDIIKTDEGRQHVESQVKKFGDDLSVTLNHLGNEAAKTVEQAFDKIKR